MNARPLMRLRLTTAADRGDRSDAARHALDLSDYRRVF